MNDPRGDAELSPAQRLVERITACWTTQAIGLAAELQLPDLLDEGPADAPTLAARCGCDSDALCRLLRALCTLEICRECVDGRFELTPVGALLRQSTDAGSSGLRALALWWGGPMWATWADLAYSVRTGDSARALRTGRSHYGFLEGSPELAALFHETMRAMTRLVTDDVVRLESWPEISTLVDVGGGHGELAASIAAAHPHLQVTVFDRADAMLGARKLLQAKSLSKRVDFVAGDFFKEVPAGADCYLLKSILHNWSDDDCRRILACCGRAAAPGTRLLLVERLRAEPPEPRARDRALARTDLNMLIGLGGRERTLAEFSDLLRSAGFELQGVSRTQHEFHIVEARRRHGTGSSAGV